MSRAGWTVLPERFRQEPVDMRAYDAWQDREGLQGASEACRAAWAQWREQWRATRRRELAPRQDEPIVVWALTNHEQHVVNRARALGAAFGMCRDDQRARPVSPERRKVWLAWRARCIRADLDMWFALWRILDGDQIGLVCARFECDPEILIKKVRKQIQWLSAELYPPKLRNTRLYTKAHSKSSSP